MKQGSPHSHQQLRLHRRDGSSRSCPITPSAQLLRRFSALHRNTSGKIRRKIGELRDEARELLGSSRLPSTASIREQVEHLLNEARALHANSCAILNQRRAKRQQRQARREAGLGKIAQQSDLNAAATRRDRERKKRRKAFLATRCELNTCTSFPDSNPNADEDRPVRIEEPRGAPDAVALAFQAELDRYEASDKEANAAK